MKPFIPVAIALLAISCGSSENEAELKKPAVDPATIIVDARYMDYAGLPDSVRIKADDDMVEKPVGYEPEVVNKEKGYYLRLTVNNKQLAKVSTDGGSNKEANLLDSTNYFTLYGKYRNCPYLYNVKGELIARTQKHENYRLFKIIRNKDIDTTYWGPLREIPVRLELSCSDLDSANRPRVKVVQ